MRRRAAGFTLIEVLVVLALISLLVTIAVPGYLRQVERARETTLVENLRTMRIAIDRFRGDAGRWPESVDELVERGYLKRRPVDPVSERDDTWVEVAASEIEAGRTGVADVRSGAEGQSSNGVPYASL